MHSKYNLFLQYMHNELGITKEDIRQWTKETVENVAKDTINKTNVEILNPGFKRWGSRYKHFRGGLYRVLCDGHIEANNEHVIIYQGEDGKIWVRPREEFLGYVDEDGTVKRFTLLEVEI